MAVFGLFFFGGFDNQEVVPAIKGVVIAGIILAALLQHWAYYNIYKPHKQQKKEKREKTEPAAQADRKG
jgi:orotate phosphoribosyltransferase-like protein